MSEAARISGPPPLSAREFDALRERIRAAAGICLSDKKEALVSARLGRRVVALGLATFADYVRYLDADASGRETRELVNAITTNKTSFFREAHHFDFIRDRLTPELVERVRRGGARRVRVWSSACSTGQEPWSIAMTLRAALPNFEGWDVRVLATDIDTNVLARAEAAVYDEDELADVPSALRASAFEPAGGGTFRVVSALRKLVTFRTVNLTAPPWAIRTKFDAIFCRNVAIYFDRETQRKLFGDLAAMLEPTGYLMSGHSENLHWMTGVLAPAGNTVYRPVSTGGALAAPLPAKPTRTETAPTAATELAGPAGAGTSHASIAIMAGGVHAASAPTLVRTTLGSCVAVCLFDPEARIGGMNHFMLPSGSNASRAPATFGIHAMEILMNAMLKLGADRSRIVAKVFGASSMLGMGSDDVAAKNAAFALQYLADEGIPVVAQKTGGTSALGVELDTESGRVRVRTIAGNVAILHAERRHLATLSRVRPIEDDITFFEAK